MAKVSLTKDLNVDQNQLFQAIVDYEKYPEFISEIKSAKVISENPKRVQFTLELMKTFDYVLEFKETTPTDVSWKLVESNLFKKNSGGWKIKKKGDKISATYSLDVEFGFLAPSFIVNKMVKKDLPKMIQQFEDRVKELHE